MLPDRVRGEALKQGRCGGRFRRGCGWGPGAPGPAGDRRGMDALAVDRQG